MVSIGLFGLLEQSIFARVQCALAVLLFLKFLAGIGVSCADDLEHVDETQFKQLLEY